MISKRSLSFLVVLLFISWVAGAQSTQSSPAGSNTPPPIVRKQLMETHFQSRPVSKIDTREIILPPGQKGPLLKHPCPVIGCIISGSINYQVKGGPLTTLKEGDPFFEPEGAVIVHFDNASNAVPAKFILNYLMDKEENPIILLDDKEQPIRTPK